MAETEQKHNQNETINTPIVVKPRFLSCLFSSKSIITFSIDASLWRLASVHERVSDQSLLRNRMVKQPRVEKIYEDISRFSPKISRVKMKLEVLDGRRRR